MKKAYILLVLLLAVLGCNRDNVPEVQEGAKTLTITASVSPVTRSHFDTDGVHLLWDASDRLMLYSIYLGSYQEMSAYAGVLQARGVRDGDPEQCMQIASLQFLADHVSYGRHGMFLIDPSGVGQRDARFTSQRALDDWFGIDNPTDDDMFSFAAMYPAPETPGDYGIYSFSADELAIDPGLTGLDGLDVFYVPVEIAAVQDGRSYWKYQTLFGTPDMIGELDDAITTYSYVAAHPNMVISGMRPVTAMLAFTMQLSPYAVIESCQVSKMTVEVETEDVVGGGYVSGHSLMAGVFPYFPNWTEDYEIRLWNLPSSPFFPGNNRSFALKDDAWDVVSGASSTLTLQFAEPVTIGKDAATDETFYAIVPPTNNVVGTDLSSPRYVITAYDATGAEVLHARLLTASQWGLMEGHKYSFNLLLKEEAEDMTMLFEGTAGSYQDGGDPFDHE